jgi:hypothetical protein
MKTIIVSAKKTKSQNNVWAVAITGDRYPRAHCKSAYAAMRYMFVVKKQTGVNISENCLTRLSHEIASLKKDSPAAPAAEEPSDIARYHAFKEKHPEALYMRRIGDEYAIFEGDAFAAISILGKYRMLRKDEQTVTFPADYLDIILPKLVRAGKKIAIDG